MLNASTRIDFSVLMATYREDNPRHLVECLQSIYDQTQQPNQLVLVKDGILTPELEQVIERWMPKWGSQLTIVSLARNTGLAAALNEGLKHCTYSWIARMDSDDVAEPERFQKQLDYLRSNLSVDVVGSWIEEFNEDLTQSLGFRKVPLEHDEIYSYAKRRNPMNHMTIMFRKESVLSVGGYPQSVEDYSLWGHLLLKGYKLANIPEILVKVRTGNQFLKRRGGHNYAIFEIKGLNYLRKIGFLSLWQFIVNVLTRSIVRLGPAVLRRGVYKFLRHKSNSFKVTETRI